MQEAQTHFPTHLERANPATQTTSKSHTHTRTHNSNDDDDDDVGNGDHNCTNYTHDMRNDGARCHDDDGPRSRRPWERPSARGIFKDLWQYRVPAPAGHIARIDRQSPPQLLPAHECHGWGPHGHPIEIASEPSVGRTTGGRMWQGTVASQGQLRGVTRFVFVFGKIV